MFSIAAVSCLAIATALASLVVAMFVAVLRPHLPYAEPQRLVQLHQEGLFGKIAGIRSSDNPRITRTVLNELRTE